MNSNIQTSNRTITEWDYKLVDTLFLTMGCLFFIIFLTINHVGLLPTVFADEWLYSSSSRLMPLSNSVTPSYLFLLLFKNTNYFGSRFLDYARFINACFFSFSLPFVYLISRRVVTRGTAMFIAVVALLGPINSYTAYFMPEAMYFFAFWVFVWFILKNITKKSFVLGSGTGCILGFMALIKMHAIFLLPAFILFLLLMLFYRSIAVDFKKVTITIIYMLIAFLGTRLILGYLIAGHAGLNLLGEKYYHNMQSIFEEKHWDHIVSLVFIPLLGHAAGLAVLFGMPLATCTTLSKQSLTQPSSEDIKSIQILTLACLITLLGITIFTTVQIVGWDSYEVINRIHMRYYNFIFPLFLIIAGAELSSSAEKSYSAKTWAVVVFIIIVFSYALLVLPKAYVSSYIDCPELFGILYNATIYKLLSLLGIVCLMVWAIKNKWGAALYVWLLLPASILSSSYFVNFEIREERFYHRDVYDRAGQFAHQYLGRETANLVIVGSERAGLYKTLFYIDNPHASISELNAHLPLDLAKIPEGKKWILCVGDYPLFRKPILKVSKKGYSLFKISN